MRLRRRASRVARADITALSEALKPQTPKPRRHCHNYFKHAACGPPVGAGHHPVGGLSNIVPPRFFCFFSHLHSLCPHPSSPSLSSSRSRSRSRSRSPAAFALQPECTSMPRLPSRHVRCSQPRSAATAGPSFTTAEAIPAKFTRDPPATHPRSHPRPTPTPPCPSLPVTFRRMTWE